MSGLCIIRPYALDAALASTAPLARVTTGFLELAIHFSSVGGKQRNSWFRKLIICLKSLLAVGTTILPFFVCKGTWQATAYSARALTLHVASTLLSITDVTFRLTTWSAHASTRKSSGSSKGPSSKKVRVSSMDAARVHAS